MCMSVDIRYMRLCIRLHIINSIRILSHHIYSADSNNTNNNTSTYTSHYKHTNNICIHTVLEEYSLQAAEVGHLLRIDTDLACYIHIHIHIIHTVIHIVQLYMYNNICMLWSI